MNVAIVGFGTEGRSTCEYYLRKGDEVTVCDQNPELQVPEGAKARLGTDYLKDLNQFDIIVRTAGMHPDTILRENPDVGSKITTHINEFLRICPTQHVIGVTGTKGKGTTSTLITKMLEAAGHQVLLAGNIGEPPLSHVNELDAEHWVVLELSSFQLIDAQHSPHIGVCLMVVPEHLDWHADLNEYLTAKMQLFAHQKPGDIAIYFAGNENSKDIASAGSGTLVPYYQSPGAFVDNGTITIDGQTVCKTDELKLLGAHNWQNVCAAVTAIWQAGIKDIKPIREVLTSFSGLEYRLELVRELDGVKYYNDSFGTTPSTAIVAIQAFQQPKVVILGGSDKGTTFEELAQEVAKGNVRHVVLIGNTTNPHYKTVAPDIEALLKAEQYKAITSLVKPSGPSMTEIVDAARAAAKPGDVVLLSTGCASFDIFENYKDRGNQFKKAVQALA
jgi:UDP-N-acetylmuramoylalanine--D-glutamate ligase